MALRSNIKAYTSIISLLLILAMLMAGLASCTPAGVGGESSSPDKSETPAETPLETPEETPAETPVETPAASGSLGAPEETYPGDPEKEEPPANPRVDLLTKTQEKYSDNKNIGCKRVTVLSKYNVGVEYDLKAYKNTTEKVFYICLPARADLSSVTFMVNHYDGTESGPYTADFSDDEISNNELAIGNTSTYTIKAVRSDRPALYLMVDEEYGTIDDMNGSGSHSVYTYGSMLITVTEEMAKANGWTTRYESVDADPDMYCSMEMRGRGNATWGYPKKGYQFELEDNMDLLGLGQSDTFVILPNYNDATLMRNQLALWLGQEIDADFTSKFCQVDVYMNDEYLGMYMLTEKCDVGANRIEIDKNEDFLYEVNQKYLEYGEYGFLSENDGLGKIRLHTKTDEAGLARAKEIFYTADNAAYSRDEEEFLKYFDLESWAKAYIIQQFTMNHDAYWGSFYFYYDNTDGKLHACTPWDFDYSMGISWASGTGKLGVEDPKKFDISGNYLIEAMIRYDSFKKAVVDVYYNGGGETAIKRLLDMIDVWTEENRLGAEMNMVGSKARFYPDTEHTKYTGEVVDYDSAVVYLKWIIEPRIEWFDNLMMGYYADVGMEPGELKGSGSESDPYLVSEGMDFVTLMLKVKDGETFEGKYFLQTADIEVPAFCSFLGSRQTFAGVYNGNGHVLKASVSTGDGGLFPKVTGVIMNLIAEGDVSNTMFSGGIARSVSDGGVIVNCISRMLVNGGSSAGITVTLQNDSKILGCAFVGEIGKEAMNKGAIVSSSKNSQIKYCYAKPIENMVGREQGCTFTNDMAKIAAEINANRADMASLAGVSEAKLFKLATIDGVLSLVPAA